MQVIFTYGDISLTGAQIKRSLEVRGEDAFDFLKVFVIFFKKEVDQCNSLLPPVTEVSIL